MDDIANSPTLVNPEGPDEQPPDAPAPGRRWGKFLIEKVLGRGGQADVFQAFDQVGTAGHVALKVPHRAVAPADVQQWVETEAGTLTRLKHPNIVRVVEAGVIGNRPYVATELVEGVAMNSHVRTNPPDDDRVLEWMVALCEALAAAHSRGVVHRDLKPQNVIITPEGRPLLIDFGLASLVTAYQAEGRTDASGTLAFMAPEQAQRSADADHRVDVFAMGAMLKFLLTGRGPYAEDGKTPKAIMLQARDGDVERIDQPQRTTARRALVRVANRALSPDPDERFQTMHEMLHALRRAQSRRKLIWAGAAGVVFVAVVTIMAATLFGNGNGGATPGAPGETPATPEALQAESRVRLLYASGGSARELTVRERVAPGTELSVTASFPEPLYPYVLHAWGEDGVGVVYVPEVDEPTDRLEPGSGAVFTPERSGPHLVLLLASREAAEDVEALPEQTAELLRGLGEALRANRPGVSGGSGDGPRDVVRRWRERNPQWVLVVPRPFRVGQPRRPNRPDADARRGTER